MSYSRLCIVLCFCCFFFKQKTAYEMRISDWSSDVCSSDLMGELGEILHVEAGGEVRLQHERRDQRHQVGIAAALAEPVQRALHLAHAGADGRQRVGYREIGRAPGRERVCKYV